MNPWRFHDLERPSRASRDYSAARGCIGKVGHESWAEAETAVVRILEENAAAGQPQRGNRLSAYKCVHCRKWHVGHSAGPRPWWG